MGATTGISTTATGQAGEARSGMVFFFLGAYLFLIFLRPFDYIPALKVLHLPLLMAGLCLIAYFLNRLGKGEPLIPRTPTMNMFIILSIWMLVTIPFAFWGSNSLHAYWNDWLKNLALFLMLGNVMVLARQVRRAIWLCILGATAVSAIALVLDVLSGQSVAKGRLIAEASGIYAGPNYFSMTLILLMPFAIMFFFLEKRLPVRLFAGGVFAVFTVTNMFTESRAGVLGESMVVLLALWKLRDWGFSMAKSLSVIFLGLILFAPLAPKGLWDRFSTLYENYNRADLSITSQTYSAIGSLDEREELLKKAVILTAENPIFGVGMSNFGSASHKRWDTGSSRDWLGCHNMYLEYSAELGVPGLLLYLALLYAAWKTFRITRRRLLEKKVQDLPERRDLRILNDAGSISFWGYVLFGCVAHLGYNAYFFFVAGIGEALYHISARLVNSVPDTPEDNPETEPALASLVR